MDETSKTPGSTAELGVVDMARALGISPRTVRRMTRRGDLPRRMVGGQLRFLRADLDEALRDRSRDVA